ncbi:hypothetical protein EC991_004044 [Linnemannia zychae]|nr:hypothetical protein EC991_004044 [Linnemannia zychae]
MQHYQSYPADSTYAPAMDPHYNNNGQNNGQNNSYSPSPAPMGPRTAPHHSIPHTSHARTHSRSNSGAFAPMNNNQGPYAPQQTQPHIIDAPMSYQGNHANQARPYSNGPQGMSGYGSPPPPNYNTAPQDPHLHQRAPHHAHPYHAPAPPMTHSRTHSRSHSRSQSHSQQQFVSYPSIQSPPPPPPSSLRHGSPVAPVAHPHSRYGQDGYMDAQVEPVRFPMQVPQPPAPRHMMDEQMHQQQQQQLDREMSHGPMAPPVQEPLARATPAPAPASIPAPAPALAAAAPAEEEASDATKCSDCGKVYKHAASLQKHRWEHSAYWKPAAKFLLSKHQQVQLMEAAAILLGMDESRQSDKDPIVRMMSRQRGHGATGTTISSVSPATSTKSLSASPPPMAERTLTLKQETAGMMSPPAFIGRAANTTRHSVTSTTSTASSLSSTPPSLAPDDNESVIEAEDEMMIAPPSLRQSHQLLQHHPQQHHHVQQQPHGLAHHHQHTQQQLHHQQQPPMMMDMEMRQKHSEPQYYQHDSRYPAYHQQQPPQQHAEPYAPYYHH